MPSERIQRRIDRLLDQMEAAADALDWQQVRDAAEGILAFEPDDETAQGFLKAASRQLGTAPAPSLNKPREPDLPASFVNGRYQVGSS